eukprot:snap_masked-scaffold_12-processed-gene-8.45-mRNA-1 protein AED:1.00 eAED:1.00 QI:0/-1/0/0/-1/1/1/0/418
MDRLPVAFRIECRENPSAILLLEKELGIISGSFSGNISVWKYEEEYSDTTIVSKPLFTQQLHTSVIRFIVSLDRTQNKYATCSKDGILKAFTFSVVHKKIQVVWKNDEFNLKKPPSALTVISDHLICLGDEAGSLHLFDLRKKEESICKTSIKIHEDVVSSLLTTKLNSQDVVISCGLDGFIFIHKVKYSKKKAETKFKYNFKLLAENEPEETSFDSFLSLALVGNKIIAGSETGPISIFSINLDQEALDLITKFNGHPSSVDFILNFKLPGSTDSFSSNSFLTASFDGLLRVCSMTPCALVGVFDTNVKYLKQVDDDTNFLKNFEEEEPIDSICVSENFSLIAVTHQDKYINIFDFKKFFEDDESDEKHELEVVEESVSGSDSDEEESSFLNAKRKASKEEKVISKKQKDTSFYADM